MKRTNTILLSFAASIAALGCTEVRADTDTSSRLGEHPAIIAARVHANAGYDYASKMYRHPAGLALYLEAPREMGEHPAVLVHRNWSKRGYDYASKMYAHPARLALYLEAPREMGEHPAVLVARTWSKRAHDDASKIASHPALFKVAAAPRDEPAFVLDSAVAVANAAAKQEPRSTSER